MLNVKHANVAQLAELLICNQEVMGSSPIISFPVIKQLQTQTHERSLIWEILIRMVTKLIKKNKFAKELFTKKYKPRVIKPKKGKGSFKRKKN